MLAFEVVVILFFFLREFDVYFAVSRVGLSLTCACADNALLGDVRSIKQN